MNIKPSLLYPLTLLLFSASTSGCSFSSSPKQEKHKMELSLHKVRTDLEEVKHDLNTYEIEHHVLEGKLLDQEALITSIKQNTLDAQQNKIDQISQDLTNIEKKFTSISKQQEKILIDIRQLSTHANETTTALSQYKEKIAQFEKNMHIQNQQINEFMQIKNTLKEFASSTLKLSQKNGEENALSYIVKSGDTLRKIADNYQTTTTHLQNLNNLIDDRIYIGQELTISK